MFFLFRIDLFSEYIKEFPTYDPDPDPYELIIILNDDSVSGQKFRILADPAPQRCIPLFDPFGLLYYGSL